jgi:anti-sigma factor RsiW
MTHPEDLLADYVDGALRDQERAVVDAHVATCAVCREEIELARGAVSALASLADEPVPLGVTGPVLAEAGKRFERRRTVVWQRLQWAAGAAAAAALVLVVALNGGLVGEDDAGGDAAGESTAAAEAGAGAEAPATLQAAPSLQRQADVNYDEDGARSLAEEAAESQRSAEEAATGATGAADAQLVGPDRALACLEQAEAPVADPNYLFTRLIEAKFQGTAAYLAVFLQSPGAGQPADHAVVWVVAKGDCRILNLQSLPI